MEISEGSLRRMVRQVDELHRDGMKTARDEVAALHTGAAARLRAPSRRRFLRGAGTGLALMIGGTAVTFGGFAAAASAAPAAPPLSDHDIAVFAESIELAVVAAYTLALTKLHTPAYVAMATTFASHHMDHAKAIAAYAGDAATAQANPGVLTAVSDELHEAPDEMHVLSTAYDAENAAAATYLYAIGLLSGVQILGTAASILPVEAQHAAALGHALGKDPDTDPEYLPPFQTTADGLLPSKFPVAG